MVRFMGRMWDMVGDVVVLLVLGYIDAVVRRRFVTTP